MQLERILSSPIFARSERLSAFLRFIAEQALDGCGSTLKEQVIRIHLYAKETGVDGAADPIVRVDARRLRDKLREYYAEFPCDPIVISLPKGAYVPVFSENEPAALPTPSIPAPTPPNNTTTRSPRWLWPAAVIAVAVFAGAAFAWLTRHNETRAPRLISLTPFQGHKVAPTLSPDGRFVAFSSKGPEDTGKADIWIKSIDGEMLRRLTSTPEFTETSPAWSPDGRVIAFARIGEGVFITPESGGAEQKVSASGTWVDWDPSGNSLLIRDRNGEAPYGICQVSLDGRTRRWLTEPRLADGDWRFHVSPDGSQLAFVRFEAGNGDVYVIPIKGGNPRRITNWNAEIGAVVWTPDGRDLVYSKSDGLWRVPANLAQPGRGVRIPEAFTPATNLSISRPPAGHAARLAFQAPNRDLSFRIIDLTAPLHEGVIHAVKPFPASTRLEYPGPFSPGGKHFAFVSGRPPELWVSGADGSNLRQLTSAHATELSPGAWSPDGRRIAYHANIDGNIDVFTVDLAGGAPKRLTFDPSLDATPSFSRDGRWIYFSSTRAGVNTDLWRMPAAGGDAVRLTTNGGLRPQESIDGRELYYVDRMPMADFTRPAGTSRLMRVPTVGGPESVVLTGISPFWWSVANTGIYFIRREQEADFIDRYSPATGTIGRIGRLASPAGLFGGQMNVSPDGRSALVTEHHARTELILLDEFR